MLRCDYSIPDSPQVSEECKDLIRRLIVQEPSARATVADVLRHPFFLQDLPEGALNLNNYCLEAQVPAQPDHDVNFLTMSFVILVLSNICLWSADKVVHIAMGHSFPVLHASFVLCTPGMW